jgi:hypothetical protein
MIAAATQAFSGWDWVGYGTTVGMLLVVLRRQHVAAQRAARRYVRRIGR